VIAICVAGGMLQLQGAACTSGATLNTYIGLGGTGCESGALTFYSFAWNPFGSNPQSPAGGLQSTQVTVNTLVNSNGVGFQLSRQWCRGAQQAEALRMEYSSTS